MAEHEHAVARVAVGEPVVDHRYPRVDRRGVVVGDGALCAEDLDRVAVDGVAEPMIESEDGGAEPFGQRVVAAADVYGGI